MITGVGPILVDTCLSEQGNANLAMRGAGDRAIEGTQNPAQSCASRLSREESGWKPSGRSEGIQALKTLKTLLHFRRWPKHVHGQTCRLEEVCPDDCQLKVPYTLCEQYVLPSVRAQQDGDLTGNVGEIKRVMIGQSRCRFSGNGKNVRTFTRRPKDVRGTCERGSKKGSPKGKDRFRLPAS